MIKQYFNREYPPDKTMLGRAGRFVIVRGSYPSNRGPECKYGVFIPGHDALVPQGDDSGIAFTYEEICKLAQLLPSLVAAGDIRPTTPAAEFKAAVEAVEAAKNAQRPAPLW